MHYHKYITNFLKKTQIVHLFLSSGDSSQDETEEEAKPVMVKFAQHESEEAKARRMASYEYVQKQLDDEPWCKVDFHNLHVSNPHAFFCVWIFIVRMIKFKSKQRRKWGAAASSKCFYNKGHLFFLYFSLH